MRCERADSPTTPYPRAGFAASLAAMDRRSSAADDAALRSPPPPAAQRRWLLPATSTFAALGIAAFAGVWAGPGCQGACQGDFDCVGAGYCSAAGRCERDCYTDEDCRNPPICQENPTACRPLGLFCSGSGRCKGSTTLDFEGGAVRTAPGSTVPTEIHGWHSPPGVGYAYIIKQIALADEDRGFDIDGQCDENGCIDNALHPLGKLANDQIRQGLLGGESLLLLELAGLDECPFTGDACSFTIKIYGAEDADEPFFPANNFTTPKGHTTCCEFKINDQSLDSPPPQAKARAPATLDHGLFRSLQPVPIEFTLTVGAEPHPVLHFEKVLLSGWLASDLSTIDDGLLGGAVPVRTLYETENPYCRMENQLCRGIELEDSTLLDLVVNLLVHNPDIDLDYDGQECLYDISGGKGIDRCCDGAGLGTVCDPNGQQCIGATVPESIPGNASSCALSYRMNDGYSLAIAFSALRARIVGTGQ